MRSSAVISAVIFMCIPFISKASCLSAIKADHHQQIWEKCTNETAMSAYVFYNGIGHDFGSYRSPSDAAALVKDRAVQGQSFYQYLWGLILNLYLVDLSKDRWLQAESMHEDQTEIVSFLRAESLDWLIKAGDQGSLPAMQAVTSMYIKTYAERDVELEKKTLSYADKMLARRIPGAEAISVAILEKQSKLTPGERYLWELGNYKELSVAQVKALASSATHGFFKHESVHVEVQKKPEKAKELYRFLKDAHKDAEAAFLLAKLIGKTGKQEALVNYQWAAIEGHSEASMWLGEYFSCHGDIDQARAWLNKAKAQGNFHADLVLQEIDEIGESANCREGWI